MVQNFQQLVGMKPIDLASWTNGKPVE